MKKRCFCIAAIAVIAASILFFPFTGSNKITKNAAVGAVHTPIWLRLYQMLKNG